MKIREIKRLLGEDNGYIWQFSQYKNGPALCIGSGYVGNLIEVPLEQPYRIILGMRDTKDQLNPDLRKIYDGLEILFKEPDFQDLMEGKDEVENPVPVYYIEKGKLIESVTEKVEWRNITANGDLIYENTHFETAEEALKYGIKDAGYAIKSANEKLEELSEQRKKTLDRKNLHLEAKKHLQQELNLLTTTTGTGNISRIFEAGVK